MADLLGYLHPQVPSFLDDLRSLVAIDSGSGYAPGVTAMGDWCAARLEALGCLVEKIPCQVADAPIGNAIVARRRGEQPGRTVLLLAHLDTVFGVGEAAARPMVVSEGRAMGPGVSDDKAGVLTAIYGLQALLELGDLPGEVIVVLMPDEEVGSPGGRPVLQDVARRADVVLALECARENGDLVSARSGVGDAVIALYGRAAHAGIEPERGVNALIAAANLTLRLQALNRPEASVTVNVGVVEGGSRPNVVPDQARLEVDVRATTIAAFDEARAAVAAAVEAVSVDGITSELTWREVTPPMEQSPDWLIEAAVRAGREVGVEVRHAATGGVGDANITAAMGIPTLDGLGPIGGADHSPQEWLATYSIAPRVALMATLLRSLLG